MVTASRDRTAKLWDATTASELGQMAEGHEFLATSAMFFDDGRRLVTGAGDNTARVWDVGTGAELRVFRGTGRSGVVAVDDEGRLLATGGTGNTAQVWDLASGDRAAELVGHDAEVAAIALSSDGSLLATGDSRGKILVWRIGDKAPELAATLTGHSRSITALAFGDSNSRLYSSSGDNTCAQWDLNTGSEIKDRILRHPDWVATLDVQPEVGRAVTACEDGHVRVWDLTSATVLAEAGYETGSATGVGFSPDGTSVVVTSGENRGVWIWDWQNETQADLESEAAIVEADTAGSLWTAVYAPDGKRILTVGGNDAQLVDLSTGTPGVRFSPHGAVAAVATSPDGRLIATGSWDGSAKLWDAQTRQVVGQLAGGHTGYINSIDFDPNGQRVATASDDGTVRLWDVATTKPVGPPVSGHDGGVESVRFSPDGTRLLTASNDHSARLWDCANRSPDSHLWRPQVGRNVGRILGRWQPRGHGQRRQHRHRVERVDRRTRGTALRPHRQRHQRSLYPRWRATPDRQPGHHGQVVGYGDRSRDPHAHGPHAGPHRGRLL